jgi:hypothetical protein
MNSLLIFFFFFLVIQGGSASGERALTAFVLIALKEAGVIPGVSAFIHDFRHFFSNFQFLIIE